MEIWPNSTHSQKSLVKAEPYIKVILTKDRTSCIKEESTANVKNLVLQSILNPPILNILQLFCGLDFYLKSSYPRDVFIEVNLIETKVTTCNDSVLHISDNWL